MTQELADALGDTLMSPNCYDSNGETANVVDGLYAVASAIQFGARHLGHEDATTPMGSIEGLGKAILDSSRILSCSLESIASAIRDSNDRLS